MSCILYTIVYVYDVVHEACSLGTLCGIYRTAQNLVGQLSKMVRKCLNISDSVYICIDSNETYLINI